MKLQLSHAELHELECAGPNTPLLESLARAVLACPYVALPDGDDCTERARSAAALLVPPPPQLDQLRQVAFDHAWTGAFDGEYFDLCALHRVFGLHGRDVYRSPHNVLYRALHCARWATLPPTCCTELRRLVLHELGLSR